MGDIIIVSTIIPDLTITLIANLSYSLQMVLPKLASIALFSNQT